MEKLKQELERAPNGFTPEEKEDLEVIKKAILREPNLEEKQKRLIARAH